MGDNVIYCPQCGTPSIGGAGYCQKCGARLVSAATPVLPPPTSGGIYQAAAAPAFPAAPAMGEHYGGFWIRVVAYLVDRVLILCVTVPLFMVMVFPSAMRITHEADQNGQPGPEVVAAVVGSAAFFAVIVIVGVWLYEALLTSSSWQGTVGKRILRLKVTDDFGNRIPFARATGRFFAKILSGLVMDVGFIMVAFMERKRGLHDVICGTQVLRY